MCFSILVNTSKKCTSLNSWQKIIKTKWFLNLTCILTSLQSSHFTFIIIIIITFTNNIVLSAIALFK